jgi:hypothetical protein
MNLSERCDVTLAWFLIEAGNHRCLAPLSLTRELMKTSMIGREREMHRNSDAELREASIRRIAFLKCPLRIG